MEQENSKISIRQLIIIVVMAIFSSVIRVIPKYCSEYAKTAAWITPIIGIVPLFILIYVLYAIMKKGTEVSLDACFENILGKRIGKLLTFVYTLCFIIMLAVQVRYFAEKYTLSIFHKVGDKFFVITILLIIQMIVRNNIQKFARFIEVFFPLVVIFIFLTFLISTPDIKLNNLYPVTIYDTSRSIKISLSFNENGRNSYLFTFLG